MAQKSDIEWTDATWNPVTGCTKVGAGCDNCYAERFAERWRGIPGHPYEQGFDLTLWPSRLRQPMLWKKPRMIFVNSMSDLFHKDIDRIFIDQVFDAMEHADWHVYQVLTKRSSLMRNYIRKRYDGGAVPRHIWLGVSVAKACVLAHRDELTAQNRAKFQRVVPGISTSVIDATEKTWDGQVAFAMVPKLARTSNLADMPRLDLLVIDEAHHAVADSYRRIIDRVRDANPDARIFGVTATPNRGDKKGLREVFDNVADQVRLGELIASGHLVPPRTFVIDVGVQDELRSVRKTLSDFDMAEVAGIMDRAPVTDEVIRHWKEKAGDRQTVVFCSTVAHAEHVTEAFRAAGITAALIHGDLASETRKAILADYAAGGIRVIVNVAVLTEGWVRVVDEVSGAVFEQEITTDLPANTQFLSPRLFLNNGATAAAVAYDCSGVYVETDF